MQILEGIPRDWEGALICRGLSLMGRELQWWGCEGVALGSIWVTCREEILAQPLHACKFISLNYGLPICSSL